jgi:hypothetical protein
METTLQFQSTLRAARGLEDVRDHMGNPPSHETLVFARPPVEIGQVLSVESTMPAQQRGMSMPVKLAIVAAACSVGALATAPLLLICWRWHDWQIGAVCTGSCLLLTIAVVLGCRAIQCRFTCTFVGTAGLARFTLPASPWASRRAKPRRELLLFRDAAGMRASVKHGYLDGIYNGTRFGYAWFDARGSRLFRISGGHHTFESVARSGNAFHFAIAAESAWSGHVLRATQAWLDREGSGDCTCTAQHPDADDAKALITAWQQWVCARLGRRAWA